MKILLIAHGYPRELIGGTELYVERLARELQGEGHQVSVFAGSVDWREQFHTEPFELDGISGLRVHRNDLYFDRWDKGYNPLVSAALHRHLLEIRPDVVHLHHWIRLSTDLVGVAARLGIPAVVTAHDLYTTCPRVFRLRGEHGDEWCDQQMGEDACTNCVQRWKFQQDAEIAAALSSYQEDMRRELVLARRILAPSGSHARFLQEHLLLPAGKFEVVPHGSLAEGFEARPKRGEDGRVHLVYWSHLHPIKGAHLLLRAVAECGVADRFHVHLYGEPSGPAYRERLEELARAIQVTFHGAFRPADLVSATMDVAVIPTLARESYSFLLDEAVMLGVPILATDFGAISERATPRVMTFQRNDPADLAARLKRIAEEPDLLERMRASSPPDLIDFKEHLRRLLPIYERVLSEGPPEAPLAGEWDRLREQWDRREVLFRELVRIESWEDVVKELRRRVSELEDELRGR
ncbi:MAG: glycosyltransferase [Planctomycetota bacterium]